MASESIIASPQEANGISLDDKYVLRQGRIYLNGIQALVRMALEQSRRDALAGLNTAGFISGYRGSPLGTLDQQLWKAKAHLDANRIHFQPGLNEELAATSVWGSQQVNLFPDALHDGIFSIWYGKAPGVDRAGDALRHGSSAGSSRHGGVLVLAGDDHGCKSASLPAQSELMALHGYMPILNPAGLGDLIDYGLIGWAMSRFSGCWVMLKCLADTMDASASITISPDRPEIFLPQDFARPASGLNIRWPDPPLEQERRIIEHRLPAVLAFARANNLNRTMLDGGERPRLGIAATGKSYLDVRQALDALGVTPEKARQLGVTVYKVGMSWPLEPEGVRSFADGLERLVVVEEKRGIIEEQLARLLYQLPDSRRPRLTGKTDDQEREQFPVSGELAGHEIRNVLGRYLRELDASGAIIPFEATTERAESSPILAAGLKRVPYFCSGCPHNSSTKVPEGSRALAGIGCHYMAQWMDRNTDTFTQMGGEGASWIGQAPFTGTPHVFVNLGDGTYAHSGSLAIRAALAAGVNITYKLLYNDAVAMTGGQTAEGGFTVPQIVAQLQAEGVKTIFVLTEDVGRYPAGLLPANIPVRPREDLDKTQRELREVTGVSVLIYDQTCAAELRRRRKQKIIADPARRTFINKAVCEGCGDCGIQSNCVSILPVETEFGRKREIDQSSCNKDFSCIRGFCPSFVTVSGGKLRKASSPLLQAETIALPDPILPSLDRPYDILIAGVGGTGIVTIGALIGMAAHVEGKGVSVLDMIGLSQKGGPVLSQVRVGVDPAAIPATRIPKAGARLLLGGDLLVGAGADALSFLNPEAGVAVFNDHLMMPADFTRDPDLDLSREKLLDIVEKVGGKAVQRIDATGWAVNQFGDGIMANPLLLGFAWQRGLIPLKRESLHLAIRLNGVAAEANIQAFEFGRHCANDPAATLPPKALAESDGPPLGLAAIVEHRAAHLIAYQNQAYADRYRALVDKVAEAERDRTPSHQGLAEAVALSYAKLLAIKDEYEVARLYTDGRFRRALESQFEGDIRLTYHLAPPLFAKRDPVSGHLVKSSFGPWMRPVFSLLASLKGLRGTHFDPFGWLEERRMERRLISEYEAIVDTILNRLEPANHAIAVSLASLPLSMRGFGHVKEAAVKRAKEEEKKLLERLDEVNRKTPSNTVEILEPVS